MLGTLQRGIGPSGVHGLGGFVGALEHLEGERWTLDEGGPSLRALLVDGITLGARHVSLWSVVLHMCEPTCDYL